MRKASALIAACVLAGLHFAVPALSPAAATGTVVTLCDHAEHRIVYGPNGRAYQVRNAYWHGTRTMCITNNGLRPNFTVTSPPGADPQGLVSAYPDTFRGCIWHICSPNAGIPIQVSDISTLTSTWHTRQGVRGSWNAAYDLWLGKRRMITGQADGAELMIWLNRHGSCCRLPRHAPTVRVDGYKFRLLHWRHYSAEWGVSWNYIQFRLVHPRWRIDHLALKPFIVRSVKRGLVRSRWWLENVTAGFEIWHGGRGLQTTDFRVSLTRRR
jgi:hypothetical protein